MKFIDLESFYFFHQNARAEVHMDITVFVAMIFMERRATGDSMRLA